jgi:flagellin
MGAFVQFSTSNSAFIQRQLALTNEHLRRSFERLSSGLRIVHAADDPAGLAFSERLRGQIASLSAVGQNLSTGLGLVQSADAQLNEVNSLVLSLRELATRAANETLSASDRTLLQAEFQGLATEARRIIDNAQFNGLGLFNTNVALTLQVGPNATDTLAIQRSDLRASAAALTTVNLTTLAGASAALTGLNTFQGNLAGLLGTIGTTEGRLTSLARSTSAQALSLTATESRIRDVDVAVEAASLARNQVLQAASVALLAQANVHGEQALALFDFGRR